MGNAHAIGPTLYAGNVLKAQNVTPRARPVRRLASGAPVRAPEGMTRAEVADLIGATMQGSAEFLAYLAGETEITTSPANVAQVARNLRDLAEILDAGADALAGADE